MQIKNTTTQYGLLARVLHWSSVTLLLALIVIASQFEDLQAGAEKTRLMALHVLLGLGFFALMLARLRWRQINHNPIHSYSLKPWQKLVAISLHRSIYIVLLVQCLMGMASVVTAKNPGLLLTCLSWLPLIGQPWLHQLSVSSHVLLSMMIYPLFAIHITAAMYHQIFGLMEE